MPIDPLRLLVLLAVCPLLFACASSPVADGDIQVAPIGPAHVLAEQGHEGQMVVWGGRIAAVYNLSDRTELEIVSLPLDRADRPRLEAEPGVRFVAVQAGFLEPMQYAPGRYVTLLGSVEGIEQRSVGEFLYDHPVMVTERLHLWPRDTASWRQQPRFSVGIGIRL